jgi:hypothetical protein
LETPRWVEYLTAFGPIIIAIPTVFLAIFTWRVAKRTEELGRDTVASAELADWHHQETLNPLVILERITVGLFPANLPQTISPPPPPMATLYVFASFLNLGGGPALDGKLTIKAHMYTAEFDLGALPLGYNDTRRYEVNLPMLRDTALLKDPPYTLDVGYKSIFGTEGSAAYKSTGGNAKPEEVLKKPQPVVRTLQTGG